ncbi:DUF6318 family protein [Arthrobacter sp. NyZ413]|uniref:DUF6318 family protein n=1 Tax=Arthrobacter sp. NyZ413 TaxID=3144669 RepID=UPI003BF90A7E
MTSRTSISFRARFFVIAVVGVMLGLAGCTPGGPPEASQTGSPSASPSITATPTPTPAAVYKPATSTGRAENVPVPVLPEAAKANSKEGLEAFARYWYDLMNFAYQTGDLTPVDAVSGAGCNSCSRVRPTIEDWNSQGQWIEDHREAISYHRADGSVEKASPKTSLQADIMIAKYEGGAWSASNVDRIGG